MNPRTRKRVIFLSSVAVVLVLAGAGGVTLRRVQRDRLLQRSLNDGLVAFQEKHYDAALDKLGYYVGRRPDDGPAILKLAQCRWKIPTENGQYLVSASRFALAAAKAMPADPAPLEMLLALYQEMGYLTERLEISDRLLAIQPRHIGALRAKAECLLFQSSKEKAQAACEAWAASDPETTDAHASVVEAMRLAGRAPEQIAAYIDRVATEHRGDFRFSVFQAATHLIVLNNRAVATEALHRAVKMAPSDGPSLSLLLRLLDNYGLDKADTTLAGSAERLLAHEPTDKRLAEEVASIAAKRNFKLGLATRNLERLEPVLSAPQVASDSALGLSLFLSSMSQGTGRESTAIATRELEKRDTPEAAAWLGVLEGRTFLEAGSIANARRKFALAATRDGANDVALYLLALTDVRLGERYRAAATLGRLVDADPSWAIARLERVDLLLRENQVNEAYAQASAGYAYRPRLAEGIRLAEATVRTAEGSRDPAAAQAAETFLKDLMSEKPDEPTLLALQCRLWAGQGKKEQAAAGTKRLLQLSSLPTPAYVLGLAAQLRSVDAATTTTLLERAVTAYPANADAAYSLAYHTARSDAKRGEQILRSAIDAQIGPTRLAFEHRLAMFLDRRDDPRAIDEYRRIGADHPDDATAQAAIFESRAAWTDQATISAALKRYLDATGEESPVWRTNEARRLLQFPAGGDFAARAVQLLSPVVNAESNNTTALALLAEANRILGDSGKSIEYLTRAVEANPSDPAYYPALILQLRRSARKGEAAQRLAKFASLTNLPPDTRRERARLFAQDAKWDAASEDLRQLADSGSVEDRLMHADVLAHAGQTEPASAIFDDLMKAAAPSARVVIAAAEFAASRGDIDQGAALLDRLPADVTAAQRTGAQAEYFERHQRPAEAEKIYAQAASSGDADRAADLAMFYLRQSRLPDAARTVETALAKSPTHVKLQAIANLAKVRQGGTIAPGSFSATVAALVNDTDLAATEQWIKALANLDSVPPNRPKFIADVTGITRSSPTFYPAWHAMVLASLEDRDTEAAARWARGALAALPDDPRAAQLASQTFIQCGKLDDALDAATAWSSLPKAERFQAELSIARIQLLRDQPGEAVKWAARWRERIIAGAELAPEHLEVYAAALARTGDENGALELLKPRAEKSAAWAGSLMRVANSCKSDASLQRRWYLMAANFALDTPARLLLGSSWYDLAAKSAFADDFAKVIEAVSSIAPTEKSARYNACMLMASSHEARKEAKEAERLYREAIELAPDDPIALNNLAFLLLSLGTSLQDAQGFAEKSVQLSVSKQLPGPLLASSLDTLGQVLEAAGKHAEAVTAFERAVKLNQNDTTLWIGLAEAQLGSGKIQEARTSMTRVDSLAGGATKLDAQATQRVVRLRAKLELKP